MSGVIISLWAIGEAPVTPNNYADCCPHSSDRKCHPTPIPFKQRIFQIFPANNRNSRDIVPCRWRVYDLPDEEKALWL